MTYRTPRFFLHKQRYSQLSCCSHLLIQLFNTVPNHIKIFCVVKLYSCIAQSPILIIVDACVIIHQFFRITSSTLLLNLPFFLVSAVSFTLPCQQQRNFQLWSWPGKILQDYWTSGWRKFKRITQLWWCKLPTASNDLNDMHELLFSVERTNENLERLVWICNFELGERIKSVWPMEQLYFQPKSKAEKRMIKKCTTSDTELSRNTCEQSSKDFPWQESLFKLFAND